MAGFHGSLELIVSSVLKVRSVFANFRSVPRAGAPVVGFESESRSVRLGEGGGCTHDGFTVIHGRCDHIGTVFDVPCIDVDSGIARPRSAGHDVFSDDQGATLLVVEGRVQQVVKSVAFVALVGAVETAVVQQGIGNRCLVVVAVEVLWIVGVVFIAAVVAVGDAVVDPLERDLLAVAIVPVAVVVNGFVRAVAAVLLVVVHQRKRNFCSVVADVGGRDAVVVFVRAVAAAVIAVVDAVDGDGVGVLVFIAGEGWVSLVAELRNVNSA